MANPSSDDTQQQAELRQAFLRHLPKRVQGLQRRARRLLSSGFDVNVFQVLFEDTQSLAGAAGRYGALDVSQQLFALENLLSPVIGEQRKLDNAEESRLAGLIEQLQPLAFPQRRDQSNANEGDTTSFVASDDALGDQHGRLPTMIRTPARYWERWADAPAAKRVTEVRDPDDAMAWEETVGVGDDGASAEASQSIVSALSVSGLDDAVQAFAAAEGLDLSAAHAEVEAQAEAAARHSSGRRKIYGLVGSEEDFTRALLHKLRGLDFEIEVFEDPEELIEVLGSLVPDMVLIDAAHIDQLDAVGQSVKGLRARSDSRISLLALSHNIDVGERLKAMRAGADALLRLPASMDDVLARITELLDLAQEDPYRVLIVEDDRSQAMFADSILRKSGIRTQVVMEPLAALQALEDFHPDMILMDLYMPGCDGMELTAIIRERPDFVSTPIVFLSGEQSTDKRFEALDAGGDDFLAKPIRPKHLTAAVNNRLRRARTLSKRVRSSVPRDSTTGLFFRPWLLEQINDLLTMDDIESSSASVMFIDVDEATKLRERLGLASSEQLMRQLSALIADAMEEHGMAARYGDASFLVLLRELTREQALRFAETLRQRISAQMFEIDGEMQLLSVSIGICPLALARGDAGELLNASARSANEARRNDKGVLLYSGRVRRAGSEEEQLLELITEALSEDSFQLLFQPLIAVDGSGSEQYQTLLRLRGNDRDTVAAAKIIPLAEKHDLVPKIDRWVLARCLMTLDERRRQGHNTRLFVPQSALSLQQNGQIDWLRQQLDARQLSGDELVIDIRQADVIAHLRTLVAFCVAGKKAGLRFSLQGFDPTPTGFQLLTHLPIDFIKIRHDLVAKLTSGEQSARAQFAQLVDFARSNNRAIIAPQIEDARTAATLWSAGADFIQGNFVQRPGGELDFDFDAASL